MTDLKINGIPVKVPEHDQPLVQVIDVDPRKIAWIRQKKYMTKKEVEQRFGKLLK